MGLYSIRTSNTQHSVQKRSQTMEILRAARKAVYGQCVINKLNSGKYIWNETTVSGVIQSFSLKNLAAIFLSAYIYRTRAELPEILK